MFAAKPIVICLYLCFFNLIWWRHVFGREHTFTCGTHSFIVHGWLCCFFTIYMYKHCFLPLLPTFVMKCCVSVHRPLPHNPSCCSLPSPMCMLYLLICTYFNSLPIACPPSSMVRQCLLCIWFNIYVSVILFSFLYFIFWVCH